MSTECTQERFDFHTLNRRDVVACFDGGEITSDAGALLLREVAHKTGILRQLAACFTDHRNPDRVEHHVSELIAQRVYGLALGYEDVNDHDRLRHDPLFALLAGKADPSGADRRCANDRGKAIAGKSTLNRLEHSPSDADPSARYKKIVMNEAAMDALLVDLFLQAHAKPPEQIVLDLDATDDPVHGNQEGRFFHGYYGQYCYLPLYIFAGEFLLCARLRPSNIDACAGSVEELTRIVSQIRTKWPHVPIILRADSGFCREAIMAWCEGNGVDYVFGLAKNARLIKMIGKELHEAKSEWEQTGRAARRFRELAYRTRKSWSCTRRVVGKARTSGQGQPALCRHFNGRDADGCSRSVRGLLLRPRRDGEPDQGAAALPVRRPDEHVADAVEPVAAVPVLIRLLPDACVAAAGVGRNRDGQGTVRNDPTETAQGGGADPDHGAQGLASPVGGASLRRALRRGVSEPGSGRRVTLLKNPKPVLRASGKVRPPPEVSPESSVRGQIEHPLALSTSTSQPN